MDFVFQGFQSGLPSWVYLLLIAATLGIAWWSYKDFKAIRPLYRYGLITLRGLTFLLLLLLLLNPLFRSELTQYNNPEVLVMFDNSASVSINKGDYEGTGDYRRTIADLNFQAIDRLDFRFFSFGDQVVLSHPDSLSFDGSKTNLNQSLEIIRNNQRDARAAVLFTDGIFNQGQNPVFLSRELDIPVFTVALGDTSRLQDLVVQNIVTNATGYLNSAHPVEVTLLNQGFGGEPFQVQLISDGEVLQSETVTPTSSISSHTIAFDLQLKEEGLQQFEIAIPPKENEWTEANNVQPFSIEVLDDRQRILSLAFEIHPDVRMVRTLLMQDENSQLSTRTWLGGNRFISGDLNIDADTLDLVILHGYPGRGISSQLASRVENIMDSVPAVIFPTPGTRLENLPSSESVLPISNPDNNSAVEVNLAAAVEASEHPVMELPEVSYDRLPTIYSPIRGLNLSPGSTVLYNSRFQGTATGEPLVALQQVGNLRRAQLNAFGWYRIAQSTNPQAREFIENLIFNTVSWTATQPDNRRLKIQPDQKNFTGNEPVSFNAFLTNESGEVENEGVITLTLTGEQVESRLYNMENTGGGQYQLEIGALPEGIYEFEATAKKGNRTIDTQSGEFSVSGSNIEYVNTVRNDELLRQIAGETGGQFYTYQEAHTLWQDMDDRGLMEEQQHVETQLFYPNQHPFWFVIVIILLGAEWILRKYVALP
ncbi:CARDB domain-containing protein [Halalkalibaculum sp. DA3122]|uniref:CARDB domain-containing protein n=1 Tax=unclassified Halalkalibaculum TaxID=2964617 RepID=UPI003754B3CB